MIPLKLETLLKDRVVEKDRVEYKRGWNPPDTIKTICAYANDYNNTNGGYVVIGIKADKNERHYLWTTIRMHEGFSVSDLVNYPTSDPINDPINDPISKIQADILDILRQNAYATYEQLASELGVSSATIKRNLNKLNGLNLIKRSGSNKTGHWEIIE